MLKTDPNWTLLPSGTPVAVRKLLRRLLDRDRKRRLQHIGDGRVEIEEALEDTPSPGATGGARTRPHHHTSFGLAMSVVAALGAFVVGSIVGRSTAPSRVTPMTSRFTVSLPSDAPLAVGRGVPLGFDLPLVDVSADGTRLVYVGDRGATTQLYVVSIGEFGATPLAGTEGAYFPFFSPDSSWVGFFIGNELRKISIAGGRPETITDVPGGAWGAAWGPDTIYFTGDVRTAIWAVPDDGGARVEVAQVGHLDGVTMFGAIDVLPDDQGLLVTTTSGLPMSADYSDLRVLSPKTGEWRMLLPGGGYHARYTSSGHLVYARSGGLRAVPFNLAELEVTGEPVPVLDDTRVDSVFGYAQYDVSRAGTLVYVQGGDFGIGIPSWVDRQGRTEPLAMPAQSYGMFSLSPNGDRLAIHVGGASDQVWVYDVASGSGTRLTTDGNNGWPLWIRRGEEIAYVSREGARWSLRSQPANGSGEEEVLYTNDQAMIPWSWSPQHNRIALGVGLNQMETILLELNELREPEAFTYPRPPGREWGHRFSPDGNWIAYVSLRDGPYEIFVSPYPDLNREHKVSVEGGTEPVWSTRGDELYYHNGNRWQVSAVSRAERFLSAAPRELFRTAFVDNMSHSWDIAPDERFLMIKPTSEEVDATEVRVVLNWFEELKELVPVN